jgi:hypothetical protein
VTIVNPQPTGKENCVLSSLMPIWLRTTSQATGKTTSQPGIVLVLRTGESSCDWFGVANILRTVNMFARDSVSQCTVAQHVRFQVTIQNSLMTFECFIMQEVADADEDVAGFNAPITGWC